MAQNRGRQKKLEKKRKKRGDAQKRARASVAGEPRSEREMVRIAATQPIGEAFISPGWDNAERPELVTVVITRGWPGGGVVPVVALVDRTCLGVKSGFAARPTTHADLGDMLEQVGLSHGGAMQRCELEVAQAVIFHAIDYARTLGFEPDASFPVELVGPRPETLRETPWAHPARPYYAMGPHDDAPRILAKLDAAVGAGNYDFIGGADVGEMIGLDEEFEDEGDEGEGEGDE